MNKKQIILALLLLAGQTYLQATSMGVEFTWPQSALLWVSNISIATIKANNPWGSKYYMNTSKGYGPGSIPQVEGYYATQNPFYLALQVGTSATKGTDGNTFNNTPGNGIANSILYFSDMVRSSRNYPQHSWLGFGGWTTRIPCQGPCPQGPKSAYIRGSYSKTANFDQKAAWVTAQWSTVFKVNEFMQQAKFNNWQNAPSLLIQPSSFPSNFNGETTSYYFAQTGVDIYLPLHMISPGSYLMTADPNYVNYGPTPGNVNTPQDGGGWLPWSYGYMPANMPQNIVKTTDF